MTAHHGLLELEFGLYQERTVLLDSKSQSPLKVTRPFYTQSDPQRAQLYLMSTTPGWFGGDLMQVRVRLHPGAKVTLLSQSSTKIHPSQDFPARLEVHLCLQEAADLHWINDPLIPFKDSRLEQITNIDLKSSSRLLFWDGLMAGRVESGESWLLRRFQSELRLKRDQTPIYLERYEISAAQNQAPHRFSMDRFSYLATMLMHHPGLNAAIESDLQQHLFDEQDDILGAVNQLTTGLLSGKALAMEGVHYKAIQQRFIQTVMGSFPTT